MKINKRWSNILMVCFIPFVCVLAHTNEQITLNTNQLQFETHSVYDMVSFEGCAYTESVGKPQIPVQVYSFVVPYAATVTGISIQDETVQEVNGTYFLYPVQPPIPTDGSTPADFVEPDSLTYHSDNLYPDKKFDIVSDEYTFGYHVVTVKIYPVAYISNTKKLYIRNFTYSIQYQTTAARTSTISLSKQSYHRSLLTQQHIQAIVKNPNNVLDFSNKQVAVQPEYNNFAAENTTKTRFTATSNTQTLVPDYIIITNEALKPIFQELADWKTQKGIPALIQTTEYIAENYAGCDLQEKIRNYLKEAYAAWGAGLFVLLGGDVNIIPARMYMGYHNLFRPSDLYYATTERTWNANKNSVFGESADNVDTGRDFYLGRASVEDTTEAKIFVSKVIRYEHATGVQELSYIRNVLIANAFLQRSYKCLYNLTNNENQLLKGYCQSILNHDAWYMFDNADCSSSRYIYGVERDTICSCPTDPSKQMRVSTSPCEGGNENLGRLNFLSALNNDAESQSAQYFHLVYHMDHSSELTLGTSYYGHSESITRADIDALDNGDYLQIMFSGGCKPCTFTQDCIGEHYINNPNGGGVAFIGNSDVGWVSDRPVFEIFLEYLYLSGRYDIGCTLDAETDSRDKKRFTLLGDPEMQVWTDTPQILNVSIGSDTIITGSDTISVTLSNLPNGKKGTICLQKEDENYAVQTVSGNGTYTFPITPHTSGTLQVTVTAHNFLPFETSIPVSISNERHLYLADILIDEDDNGNSRGNGDGQIDAGETVELTLKLANNGQTTANNVTACLSCSSPYISLQYTQSSFGNIQAGDTVTSLSKYTFIVDELTPEVLKNSLNPIVFSLQITDSTKQYTDTFKIAVYEPVLCQANKTILSTTDGDELIEPGETVLFTIDLFNSGKAQAIGVTGALSYVSSVVSSYISTPVTYPNIGKYETKTSSFAYQFTVASNYTVGYPIVLSVTVSNQYEKTETYTFNLLDRPNPINTNAISFTSTDSGVTLTWNANSSIFGYNIYRSPADADGNDTNSYERVNTFLVEPSYFEDYYDNSTGYYYKIASVSNTGNESPLSEPVYTWLTNPYKNGFPVTLNFSPEFGTSINVEDIDDDGKYELLASAKKSEIEAVIAGFDCYGSELFDVDHDTNVNNGILTVYANLDTYPAIGNLRADSVFNLVFGTRAESQEAERNYLASYELNSYEKTVTKQWNDSVAATTLTYRSPMIANIDNSSDGTQEIVYICDNGYIRVVDSNGILLWEKNITSGIYGASAIADIDGNGYKEILVPTPAGLYAWKYDGTAYGIQAILYTATDYVPRGSVVVCDLNNDGNKDILIMAIKQTYQIQGKVIVLDRNGTSLSGWNGTQIIPCTSNLSMEVSVGDINRDGRLEVVALGNNIIKIWNYKGEELSLFDVPAQNDKHTPLLADVDTDDDLEIVYASVGNNHIYAYNMDGTSVIGFPLVTETNFSTQDPCVADIDNDGKNEVIAAVGTKIYAWGTKGESNLIAWGSERHDSRNTGEYDNCIPILIRENTTWSDSLHFCGDIIIQSDTLTIDSTCVLTMSEGSSILIQSGGTFNLDGGICRNVNLKAHSGSCFIYQDGIIQLSPTGRFIIEVGSTTRYKKGKILKAN